MVTLAAGFAERGHRVDLVLGRVDGPFVRDVPPHVRIVDLRGRTVLPALPFLLREPSHARVLLPALVTPSPPWVLGCLPALTRYLREERPDAMLSALNYSNVTALLARRRAGVVTRLVVSERNTLSVRSGSERKRRLRALPGIVRHFYPWADAIAAVSEGVADDLARVAGIPRARIHATYNPVATPDIPERAAERAGHPWLDAPGPPVVVGAGKLKPQKGFDVLIDAFAALRHERPARLVILGEGPERARLEARAAERGVAADVDLVGFVPNPFAFLARCAAFALSSRWEGLPGVLIQALACGAPVASTDCPSGPSEILEGGAYGPLVPVDDPGALARAIAAVLDDPPSRDRQRKRAEAFAVGPVVDRHLALLLPTARGESPGARRDANG